MKITTRLRREASRCHKGHSWSTNVYRIACDTACVQPNVFKEEQCNFCFVILVKGVPYSFGEELNPNTQKKIYNNSTYTPRPGFVQAEENGWMEFHLQVQPQKSTKSLSVLHVSVSLSFWQSVKA